MQQPLPKRCFTRREYFTYVTDFAKRASMGDSITIATMEYRPSFPEIFRLTQALIAASRQGAKVHILVDAYSIIEPSRNLPRLPWLSKSPQKNAYGERKQIDRFLTDLRESGVRVTLTNMPAKRFGPHVAGRSHIKFALLNSDVFVGGGNLDLPDHVDIMVLRRNDVQLANILTSFAESVATEPSHTVYKALGSRDQAHSLDDGSILLIDAGVKNTSTIADYAHRLLQNDSQNALITCQYPPYGWLVDDIQQRLSKNTVIDLHFNGPARHPLKARPLMVPPYILLQRALPASHNKPANTKKYIHINLLATDDYLMLGSHNYIPAGVQLGTAELAFISRDKSLGEEARQTFLAQL